MIFDVVLPLPISQLFSYRVPDADVERVKAGSRVLVPFGSRRLAGVVVDTANSVEDVENIRDVIEVLDDEPSISAELMSLAEWIADYYVCSLGEVVRALLPSGSTSGGGDVAVKIEKHVRFAPAFRHAGAVDELREKLRGPRQVAVVECLAGLRSEGEPEPRQSELLARSGASAATIGSLLKHGVVEIVEREVLRSPLSDGAREAAPVHLLNRAQEAALAGIQGAVESGEFRTFLLHGVTGSGKTEVYIRALKAVLDRGKSGIVLVPEIALTPQTVRRFRAHFGDRIAVFHSRMSQGERFDAWRALRDGRFDVVIGPRSAILLPLSNIGLIVVDEEHEPSYKQNDPAPRYNARDVAVMRARMNGAVCVLGSATPGLESFQNALSGRYELIEMHERVPVPGGATAQLPGVRIIDLRVEGKHRKGSVSRLLESAIAGRLERGEQVILLQNRRGYVPLIECRECGWSPQCRDCSVTMTVHRQRRQLRCHYCGRTAHMPERCPNCRSEALELLGVGTQMVEEELETMFPTARILRMDLDTTSGKNAHDRLLSRFGAGKADILLGTQMVAKGLDFGRVTLVGVINADVGMLLPDFRSEERTFQLLSQVAGRSGRAELTGEVIIQTRNPDRPVIRYARDHDYAAFAASALEERRQLKWPPFARLAGFEFKGADEEKVAELASRFTTLLRERMEGGDVLGPEQAFISRIKRQYRYHTIVKYRRSGTAMQALIRDVQSEFGAPPRGCRINVDIDPVGLL